MQPLRIALSGRLGDWTRALWASLLATLLLLGAVDLHPAGEEHGLVPLDGDALYVLEPTHPDQPLHLEPASPAEQQHCPACLHHLQTRGAYLRAASILAPPAPQLAPVRETGVDRADVSRRLSGARAPPSFS